MKITLELTKEEIQKLESISWTDDEGPTDEGWPSEHMRSLWEKIRRAIEEEPVSTASTIRPQGDERAHPLWPAFCAWCLDYLRLKGEVAPYAYWHCYLAGAVQGAKKVVVDMADKGRGGACS